MRSQVSKQQGISMLEVMLVLVVATSLILMAVRYYKTVSREAEVTQLVHQVKVVVGASYQWLQVNRISDFSGHSISGQEPSLPPISLQVLLDANLLTPQMLALPKGIQLEVAPASQLAPHEKGVPAQFLAVRITVPDIKTCKNLVFRLTQSHGVSDNPCQKIGHGYLYQGVF